MTATDPRAEAREQIARAVRPWTGSDDASTVGLQRLAVEMSYRAADAVLAVPAVAAALAAVDRVRALADELIREASRASAGDDPESAHAYLNAAACIRRALGDQP
jgi:hypothetical protein